MEADDYRQIFERDFSMAFQEYRDCFGEPREVDFSIIISNNIVDTLLGLADSDDERQKILSDSEAYNELNGTVFFPSQIQGIYSLIIHSRRVSECLLHCQTCIHEFTHIQDYSEYAAKLKLINIRWEELIPNRECISFYSEVRARYRSTVVYYRLVNLDVINIEDKLASLVQAYMGFNGDFYKEYYNIAQFYGQYLALQEYSKRKLVRPEFLRRYKVDMILDFLDNNIEAKNIYPAFTKFCEVFYQLT